MPTPWPPWLNKNVLGFSAASVMSDASHEVVPLVLPLLVSQLMGKDVAPTYVALIGGTSTAVASLTGLYAGKMSDHLADRKPLIVLGYFVTGSLVGLLAYAHHWLTLFFLMTGAWIGRGLISAPRSAIIADSTPKSYYGRAFGFRQAFDTLGSVLGPFIVYMLADWSPQNLFLITFIPGTLAFLIILLLVKDVPHAITKEPFSLFFMFQNSFSKAYYYMLGAFFIFGLGNFNKSLLVLHMQEVLSKGSSATGALSSLALMYIFRNIIQTFSSYAMGALSDKVGRLIPLAIGGFGFFGCMCFLLASQSSSLTTALFIFFLSGFSAGTYVSLQKSLAADVLPQDIRGTGYGIVTTIDSLAALLGSIMVGILWSSMGAKIAFSIAGGISFLSIIALLPLRSYQKLS